MLKCIFISISLTARMPKAMHMTSIHRLTSGVLNISLRQKHSQPALFPQRLILPENRGFIPTLSPSQITTLLADHEATLERRLPGRSPIRGFVSNQLASNHPIEDRRAVARLQQTNGSLFGVFDGHAGVACAQSVSERLFDYMAVTLLSSSQLEEYAHLMKTDNPMTLLKWFQFNNDYTSESMAFSNRNSLQKFVIETLSTCLADDIDNNTSTALINACVTLDNAMSSEGLPENGMVKFDHLEVAMSGSCSCAAHVNGIHLNVANVGDTRAVLGQLGDDGHWIAKPLSVDHNVDNPSEVGRVRSSHPSGESSFILKNNRLLAQLIPLRAFGDMRYKWSMKDLKNTVSYLNTGYGQTIIPMNYHTPPYLIAEPEVLYHRLTPSDKFLVLATDGLWEMLSNEKVVQLVGEHLEGKETQDIFQVTDENSRLGDINSLLRKRITGLSHKTSDTNVATHLIRHALGKEHRKVSEMLTLPSDVVRFYRDDITIIVVYFDSNFISQN